jgi:RecB family exonuclease
MPASKRLLTGPHSSALRDRLIDEPVTRGSSALWLVPTPLARRQVVEAIARRDASGATRGPRVWCWGDLWRAIGDETDGGPVRLSPVGARAALGLALDRAREEGRLRASAEVAAWPGFRRRLRDKFAAWTRRERSPDDPPETEDPVAAEEWAVFGHYREVLRSLDAVDVNGFAVWASRVLVEERPESLRKLACAVMLDVEGLSPAEERAWRFFEKTARSVRVATGYDPDPNLVEVYEAAASQHAALVRRHYEEVRHAPDLWRPPGLRDLECELFRPDAHLRPPMRDAGGLTLLGAPQGEGVGLVVAREVKRLLDERRVAAEEVLVLCRAWDDDAEAVVGVMRSWGLPVSSVGRPPRLDAEPAVSALRRALRLGPGGWEAAEVVRLLRHGRLRPDWPELRTPGALARAAAAVRDVGAFAGRDAIDKKLAAASDEAGPGPARDRLAVAHRVIGRLFDAMGRVNRPGTWTEHAARLRRLAAALGLDSVHDPALERLDDAMEDHAAVLEAASGPESVPFADFVAAVERIAAEDVDADEPIPAPGTVVVTTVDRARGSRARFVVLANLAEGTFPTRAAVEGGPRAFGREMALFLQVAGSAAEGLILAYPTADETGREVLPAGFLDEIMRQLAPAAREVMPRPIVRLDPALLDDPDLAVAPADRRVRAVALASLRGETGKLSRLAREADHRLVLHGTAAALVLTQGRLRRGAFSDYDGLLREPALTAAVATRFAPEVPFSASQLESYLTCPFQFFAKYVLGLKPVDDRDDLDENFILRGNLLHRALENVERRAIVDPDEFLDVVKMVIATEMSVELTTGSAADPGLQEIAHRRLHRTMRDYAEQRQKYLDKSGPARVVPVRFEAAFGGRDSDDDVPSLVIGEGPSAVRIQGKIDRVDLVETEGERRFRVIDYKTGAPPSMKEVKDLRMVQLHLYALAVERLLLVENLDGLLDLGYWSLKKEGYKPIKLGADWPDERDRLEAKVLATAGRLRAGEFVVRPEKPGCEQTCDYGMVCRIGQVRHVEKTVEPGGSPP